MPILIQTLLISLARKYAADLLTRILIEALEKLAPRTDNKIDDRLVEILKAERTTIANTLTKQIGG